MNFMSALEPGNRLSLIDGDQEWSGSISRVMDGGRFTVLRGGTSVGPELDREYCMICVKENGIHRFHAKILRSERVSDAMVDYCQYTGDYVRMQRRDAFRCPMALDVKVRKVRSAGSELTELPWVTTKTVNISETGMCVSLDSGFKQGDLIECTLYINTCGIDAVLPMIFGAIVWTMDLSRVKQRILCGVQFEQIDRRVADLLLKLVTLGQIKNLGR